MKLSQVVIKTESVEYAGQDIDLRGLGSRDLEILASRFGPKLAKIYNEKFAGTDASSDLSRIVKVMVAECPECIPTIITLANDSYDEDPEEVKESERIAGSLPTVVQAECLGKIIQLSVVSIESLKKIVAMAFEAMASVQTVMTEAVPEDEPSPTIGGPSKARSAKK